MAVVIILLVVIVGLAVLPQLWVRSVISRNAHERGDLSGTGGEFARHLLDGMKLAHVGVEQTDTGDHYDPESRVVRLSKQHYGAKSLSAIVIAAHEVGHAMQDATNYGPLKARTRLAKQAHKIQNVGFALMLAAPLLVLFLRSPALMFVEMAAGIAILSVTVMMHVFTLPVEFDASFKRALPVLKAGGFIPEQDMPAAREILRAAAFTYVAAAAMSMLDVMRWLRVLRF
ncbi:MAG: zinc metallopeptidase [Hyphomicrobiaceae bacterium]